VGNLTPLGRRLVLGGAAGLAALFAFLYADQLQPALSLATRLPGIVQAYVTR
jgi:hypothetical protein